MYHVTFMHQGGYGSTQMSIITPLDSIAAFQTLGRDIEKALGLRNVLVMGMFPVTG